MTAYLASLFVLLRVRLKENEPSFMCTVPFSVKRWANGAEL